VQVILRRLHDPGTTVAGSGCRPRFRKVKMAEKKEFSFF
jgi:hypothetical protein